MENKPYVRIIEQPASKALRFRYQCEGRSAGSIPGANSTSEVKSYPTIQICGYKGPAVVLVSCVTKDPPYRPHPHNLVGREGCKKGVCTLEFPQDTMSITFSNLGIQCVKKRDIADNLDERKEYKVDPFNTGFSHKNTPTSIDLNAVRLCFQCYIIDVAKGDHKYSVPLTPVVSDPIYDKKAMCDLTIVKLSDCVSSVDGGRKDIILLCEKVAKEDIEVRFFEEVDGHITWEAKGDFQPSQVHKQTAIWFRAPKYKTLDIIEPVRVNIQLRRPSDGAVSEPLPFEMLPLDSGRPSFWPARRNYKKASASAYELFNSALASDAEAIRKRQLSNLEKLVAGVEKTNVERTPPEPEYGEIKKSKLSPKPSPKDKEIVSANVEVKSVEVTNVETKDNTVDQVDVEMTHNYEPVGQSQTQLEEIPCDVMCTEEDVIREVVELDEIYSENQKRIAEIDAETKVLQEQDPMTQQESFDDSKTYSSLQMAFKNPLALVEIDIDLNDKYEDVIVNPNAPIIDIHKQPSQNQETTTPTLLPPPVPVTLPPEEPVIEALPPLPPKRSRKVIETDINDPGITTQSQPQPQMESIPLTSHEAVEVLCTTATTPISLSRSHSMISRSQTDLAPSRALPPKPTSTSTLPNPKKRGFFSKLFGRKQDPHVHTSHHSLANSKHGSVSSFTSVNSNRLHVSNASLNRTPSNASNKSQLSYRIPLKDSSNDLNDLNLSTRKELQELQVNDLNLNTPRKELQELQVNDFNINLNSINNNNEGHEGNEVNDLSRFTDDDDFNMNLDLTEAEHYALYTAMAPHATQSEFDEMSAYYAPVEGGSKRKRKLETDPNIALLRPLQEHVANRQPYNTINNRQLEIKEEPLENPYMSPGYLGHSPTYVQPSVSPSHYPPGPVAGANIPIPFYQQQAPDAVNALLAPEPQWNVPFQETVPQVRSPQGNPAPVTVAGVGLMQACGMAAAAVEAPMSIDSNDLQQLIKQYNVDDTNALSDSLSKNLNFSDNMPMTTDSLSRLANNTYDTLFDQNQ